MHSRTVNIVNINWEVYFIGKIPLAKGVCTLLKLEDFCHECTRKYFSFDIYWGHPNLDKIKHDFQMQQMSNHTKGRTKEFRNGRSLTFLGLMKNTTHWRVHHLNLRSQNISMRWDINQYLQILLVHRIMPFWANTESL